MHLRRVGYGSSVLITCRRHAEHGVAPEAVAEAYHAFEQGSQISPLSAAAVSNQTIQESQRLLLLVRAYQVQNRFLASDYFSWHLPVRFCYPVFYSSLLSGVYSSEPPNPLATTAWLVVYAHAALQGLRSMLGN